jgi:cyclase
MDRYVLARTMRVLKPLPFLYAFYDGREGKRLMSDEPNWVDDGAYVLGIASYALVDEDDAIVYDTHITLDHAHKIRNFLEAMGVKRIRVVLSHSHLDHIAGNEAFADCEIIANSRTLALLKAKRTAIETARQNGPPAISRVVFPTTTFEDTLALKVGRLDLELRHVDIHSSDGTMLILNDLGTMLAGDALEDTVTYIAEPHNLDRHLKDLDRMWTWEVSRILPNHGDPSVIAQGGYRKNFIRATQQYIRTIRRCGEDEELKLLDLQSFAAGPLRAGWISYFEPYERIHRQNVERVVAAMANPVTSPS